MRRALSVPRCLVRPMALADIAPVAAIAAEEATAPHWPVVEYVRMLEVIADAPHRRGAWVLLPLDRAGGLSLPAGFSIASHVAGTCELEAVVVGSCWRGQGFGAALVTAAVEWGRSLGAGRLELEVRVSNAPARRLYQRLGFAQDGTRSGYYRNPDEDAALLSLRLERQLS